MVVLGGWGFLMSEVPLYIFCGEAGVRVTAQVVHVGVRGDVSVIQSTVNPNEDKRLRDARGLWSSESTRGSRHHSERLGAFC